MFIKINVLVRTTWKPVEFRFPDHAAVVGVLEERDTPIKTPGGLAFTTEQHSVLVGANATEVEMT